MTGGEPPESSDQGQKGAKHCEESALQAARSADADQATHEQPEIEAADVNEQALQNDVITTSASRRPE